MLLMAIVFNAVIDFVFTVMILFKRNIQIGASLVQLLQLKDIQILAQSMMTQSTATTVMAILLVVSLYILSFGLFVITTNKVFLHKIFQIKLMFNIILLISCSTFTAWILLLALLRFMVFVYDYYLI